MFVFAFRGSKNGEKKSSGICVKRDAIRIPKIDQARVALTEGLVTRGRETEIDSVVRQIKHVSVTTPAAGESRSK